LDYGSFYDNVHNHDITNNIGLTFKGETPFYRRLGGHPEGFTLSRSKQISYCYKVSISGSTEKTRISALRYEMFGQHVEFITDSESRIKIRLNNRDHSNLFRKYRFFYNQGLFPIIYIATETTSNGQPTIEMTEDTAFLHDAARILRTFAHQNTTLSKITNSLSRMVISDPDSFWGVMHHYFSDIQSLRNKIPAIPNIIKEQVWLLAFMSSLNSLNSSIRDDVEGDLAGGGYLGPIRARASRYYRRQELAVDRIDPSGENLAMYLNSLPTYEKGEISKEFSQFFGHEIKVHAGEGHISLRISAAGDSHEDNLADVGFGFSQLLPVLAQVHAAKRTLRSTTMRRGSVGRSPLIVVEQPELHLHPAYQTKLGAYFADVATRADGMAPFRFVIETHSEPLVNEIAALVARKRIPAEAVKIYLFEREPKSKTTNVVKAEVRPDGSVPNWPFGFFSSGRIRS
jgi:hypothetical protein